MFKINHLGKVKSSFSLDPQVLAQAKREAARTRTTLGLIVEDALAEYLKRQSKKSVQTINQEHLAKVLSAG